MGDENELGGQEGRGWVQVGGDKMERGRGMSEGCVWGGNGRREIGDERESRCRCRSFGYARRGEEGCVLVDETPRAGLRLGAGDGEWDTAAEEGERWVSIQLVLLTRYVRPFASFPSSADLLLQLPRSKTVCGSRARLDADVHVEATRYERRSGRHWG
jgi:hypothetical protein